VSAPGLEALLVRLKYGSGPWNAWRDEEPDAEIVLDGANLNGMILTGANLHEADLLGARLAGARYSPDDLRGALHVPSGQR